MADNQQLNPARRSILDSGGAREQVILPVSVATRICIQGIRTRLGRSMVTVLGVALGISFLMAVLSSFHVKQAMHQEAELRRAVDRRLAVLQAEVGRLADKTILVAGEPATSEDRDFVAALESRGGAVLRTAGAAAPDLTVLLGAARAIPEAWAGRRVFLFADPAAELTARARQLNVELKMLGVALAPDELARLEAQELEARYRRHWIVVVSLLITVGSIANAMLMSVAERFREIGTMKCLGALSGFVVKLFLIESAVVGFAGALVGVGVGLLLPLIAYSYTYSFAGVFLAVSFPALLGFGLACVGTGVVLAVLAGIGPALVASRMIPAVALASHV